jgi:hypothetical protein
MTVSIGVAAVVVMATVAPIPDSTVSPAVKLSADSTALLVCGTTCPTWDAAGVELIMNQFITPTHPGQTITPVAVTTPEEAWPLTGLLRLIELAVGDPRLGGPGGPAWPDAPWWKLSGLFDLTGDQSIEAGVVDLEAEMAAHGNDHLVIYGYSQGAVVAVKEKRKLAEQYPAGTTAPDIDFVLGGDVGLPNGGFGARFPGLHIPVLDWSYDGATPTDTQFDTVEINRQYDGFADFPLYPLNVIATLNAVLGMFYVHAWPFDASLPADPTTSPAYQGTHGDTSYYFFENPDLPLFGPLRTLGVPEPVIDVIEPFFRVLVELGYDRSIPPWEPTPARLIPQLDPAKVMTDLVAAIGEGINNAFTLFGSPLPSRSPVPVTLAAPGTGTAKAEISPQVTSAATPTQTEQLTSTGAATGTQQMSTEIAPLTTKVTETAKADEASTGPTEASAPEPSADASTSEPVKPTVRRVTPRPVVRGSLGVGEQLRDLPHRGNGGHPTTRTAAAGDGAATAGPSSVASSPAASSAAGDDSSGGDAGES